MTYDQWKEKTIASKKELDKIGEQVSEVKFIINNE